MLFKNTLIKIKKSFGRYLSLLIIVMVGVGFFAGVQASAPDMIDLADQYYQDQHLMDYKIVSSMGLTNNDVKALENLKNVKRVIPSYSLDVLDHGKAIRVHAIEDTVNKVKIIKGRMPQKENECIADNRNYKIGDQINIKSNVKDKLKNNKYAVVGTVESVLYLAEDYGNTTIGDGKLASFIFINKNNFILKAYTEIYLLASGTIDTTAYSKEYEQVATSLNTELINMKPNRENARYQEIYDKAYTKISKNETKLNKEKAKNQKKLDDAKVKLDENSKKLKDGKAELSKNEADLNSSIKKQNAQFESAKVKIASGWNEINSAMKQNGIKKEELDSKIKELNSAIGSMKEQAKQLPKGSQEAIQMKETIKQYDKSYQGLLKLKESIQTLTAKEAELKNGIETFNSEIAKAKTEIEEGKDKLAENEKKLAEGYEKYNKNLKKFNTKMTDAQDKIEDAKKKLNDIDKPKWFLFDRDAAIGYSDLKSGIDVISSVAAVLPFFFVLIVMLMTSNSMARMIVEERSELGTLASLGYKENRIIITYLFYVLSASGLGALTGFFIGCRIIPPLIYSNFKFILPAIVPRYNLISITIILAVTFLLMTLVTVISSYKELKHMPASLMRPIPPESGQTILLERIKPVWKHLSFTWKVTMRNLFRFKKRAFMTIIGVAGCTALLLAGFGLKDSMNGVAQKQYSEIFRYDDMIILKDDTKIINGDLENILNKEGINKPLLINQTALKCKTSKKSLDTYLIVPENEKLFYDYYHLTSKSEGKDLTLNDSGVIITQRLSKVFHINKGDRITVKDADNKEYQLMVSDVAENYTSNYIYMNNAMYHKTFGKPTSFNSVVSHYNGDQKVLAKHLINSDLVLNVVFTSDVMQKALDSNKSLNGIIALIVVVSSLLSIIVLYNLTSINISERTREIATLKVLGFNDEEANGYIYREAFILTLISIGIGLVMGIYLHGFVVDVVEDFAPLLFKKILWTSFLMAGLLTIFFSVIMQIITYFKLQTIDMIESLKSVE